MPEDAQEEATFDIPDQDWIERVGDWYICRVHLGGEDYVDLQAVSGKLADNLDELIDVGRNLIPDDREDLSDLEYVQQALQNDVSDEVWKQIDKILAVYIKDWRLKDYAEATDETEYDSPHKIDDADERIEVFKSLPIPILARILYGLAWHTRNFM